MGNLGIQGDLKSCEFKSTFSNLPYSILNIGHPSLDSHRNRTQTGTWAAWDSTRAPFLQGGEEEIVGYF